MATNNFKPFATAANANVTAQADWETLPALLSGFMAGKASSAQVNKAIRQASFIAAALAQYTANKSGLDVLDDGDLNGFISKMGTAFGKDFQTLDATLTALAGLETGANKLPYFTGNDTAAQTDLTSVGRDIIGKKTIADILTYLQLRESFSGVVGSTRNAAMNIAAASATATFSADELIVEDSNGHQYRLSAFSKTINLATVGAGGMDTGTVPASGFIALYAIFNPTTNTSSLLAVDATNSILPDVYGGASMPAGYTASSLVSVWRVAGSKLVAGNQVGRDISIEKQTALSSTAQVGALTALSIAAITPKNAKAVSGYTSIYSTNGAGGLVIDIASTSSGVGYISTGGYTGVAGIGANGQFSDLALITPQTMYYDINPLGTAVSSWSALIAISRYSI
ncbi:hypothetical protein [Klebsiella sp. WP4-W18-ESBL-05]|uniref:hypothetical protein n=1 Tax=Klebsiella sp. WP4-W18-ESBL-05 TaxID=2675713 RepID=UPI0015DBFB47|nr:hypothetical protein [Klebsiella sp. WP4-W18-ESBL-05]BBR60314.1 hypothetical protein WP4W18E05_36820 [Klebsiella sp. WP4-W18-ESBL-05]